MNALRPDERVFRDHVSSARFQDGVERDRWRVVGDIEWPFVLIAVTAGPRDKAPKEFFLRFDLTGYPALAPTATPWNPQTDTLLEEDQRPKGDRVGYVFRSDLDGGISLYAPFDRKGLDRHPDWREKYPLQVWNAKRDLTWVLQILHQMLNDDDYTGV